MVPTISIQPPTPMYRRTNLTFTARADNGNSDGIEVHWTHTVGTCGVPGPIKSRDTATYVVPAEDTDGAFCVWVFKDRYGVTAPSSYQASPQNRDPVAKIVVTGSKEAFPPFSLYRPIQLEASMATDPDGDPLDFSWALRSDRDEVTSELQECPGLGPEARCWTPHTSGFFTASVSLMDDHGGVHDVQAEPFRVADDRFPCLAVTDPGLATASIFRAADDPNPVRIEVLSVDDDGDPFDAASSDSTGITFTWFEAMDTGPMVRKDGNRPYYLLFPDDRNLGKTIHVRVEIADRNWMRSKQRLESCGDSDVCGSDPASACRQRMTWAITYGL